MYKAEDLQNLQMKPRINDITLKVLSVIFKNENISPPTKIVCDIMFYSKAKNDNAIIHLGIKQDAQFGYYIPKTFFIEKVSSKQEDIYLSKQEEIEITVLNRTIML